MVKRGLDRLLGEGNWGPPKWDPGNYPKLKMSHFVRTGWLPKGATMGEYWDRAVKRNSEMIAFADVVDEEEGSILTFQEADEKVKKLALKLIDLGIRPGNKVSTCMVNSVSYALSILAIHLIGAVWVPLHVFYRETEVKYMLNHGNVEVLICDEIHRGFSHAKLAAKIQPELPQLKQVIVNGNPEPGQISLNEILAKDWGDKYPGNYIREVYLKENLFCSDDLVEIIYTSGTTGPPKGAMHNHDDNLQHSLSWVYHYDLGLEDSLLNLAIMSHQHGYGVLFCPFWIAGLPNIFIGDFSLDRFFKAMEKWRPTFIGLNPPIVAMIARDPRLEKVDTSYLKGAITAGAPLPMTSARSFKNKVKNPRFGFVNAYGMSECNGECGTPLKDWGSAEFASVSVGLCHIGMEARVCDPRDRERTLPIGEQGEICCRGGMVGIGYYKDPQRTSQDWDFKGWMYSGDLGYMDENGNIYITGRAKDVIVRGGNVIQPLYIEEFIRTHSEVADVAVVAIPDEKLVEATCAIIVPKVKGRIFTREEIYNFMKDKTMRDNIPDRVETWDSIPYTTTGKMIKYKMREIMAKKLEEEKKQK